jgi:hypothetical protein
VEKLSDDDDEGKNNEKREDQYRGCEELFLPEGPDKALKHGANVLPIDAQSQGGKG